MNSVKNLIFLNRDSDVPIYIQIATEITHQIRNGHLRKGLKLPGCRSLAASLNIHRRTLQMALDELHAQGWVEIHPRKGSFVTRNMPDVNPNSLTGIKASVQYPAITGFSIRKKDGEEFPASNFQQSDKLILAEGFPDVRLAPMQQLFREIRSFEKRGGFKKYFQYGDPQGVLHLRQRLAEHLNDTRGLPISSSNIIITRGAQMGTYLSAKVLLSPGDEVIVGDPGYVTATLTFQRAGGVINRVPVDKAGIDVDAIEALCNKKHIRLVYVIPHHHHPTTVTLTPERRIRLLNLSKRYKFAIVEDDYDYDFHYSGSPVLPMASIDQSGSVIYIGTLNKTLVPSIRMGFIIAPHNFIHEAIAERRSIDFQGDSILEAAIAELFKSDVISNHIKKVVRIYKERRDYFCDLLKTKLSEHITFDIPDGGLCAWVHFKHIDLVKLTQLTEKMGLRMHDGNIYNTKHSFNCTRLGFSALTFLEQEKAVEILLKGIKQLTIKENIAMKPMTRYLRYEMEKVC
jgi:GntR family transcriptional regulator/MocR family aminotransferase